MGDPYALTPTLEDYLEAICRLVVEKGAARVRDIAKAVSVDKSTVTTALNSLSEKGLVDYRPYRVPTLTSQGRRMAEDIIGRHEVIRDFLVEVLSVKPDVADANACRMEHAMDKEVLNRLALFIQFVKECPRAGDGWVRRFRRYFEADGKPEMDIAESEKWLADFKKTLDQRKTERRSRSKQ